MSKILIITSRSDHGGGPRHIFLLLNSLRKSHEFYVAAPDIGYYSKLFSNFCEKKISIPHRKFSLLTFFKILIFSRKFNIDIIHSHGRGAGYYARLLKLFSPRLKIVHTHHGLHVQKIQSVRHLILLVIDRLLLYLTDAFIFVSQSEIKNAANLGLLIGTKNYLIPNGIPIVEWQEEKKLNPNIKKLISVTRLEPEKGNDILIHLMKHLLSFRDDFVLSIVGDGLQRESLKELVKTLGLKDHIVFLGHSNNILRLLKESDVFVSASLGEAQGIAIIEAMMAGIPVVISKVLGHVDLIDHEHSGYFFELDSLENGAQKINDLLSDESLWNQIRLNAYECAKKNYTITQMVNKIDVVYKSIVSSE